MQILMILCKKKFKFFFRISEVRDFQMTGCEAIWVSTESFKNPVRTVAKKS